MTVDRRQFIAHVDRYLDALVANDPARLGAPSGVRYTENGQTLPLGKGLWGTATPVPPPYHAVYVPDPLTGQVGYFGIVSEAGEPVIMALRLKVDGERLTEAEALVCRDRETIFSAEGMRRARPLFEAAVPEAERASREQLVEAANLYLDGILQADGSMIPVADDCIRMENGVQTVLNPEATGIRAEARDRGTWRLGVAEQVDARIFTDIEAARDRRVGAIDEERGLVFVIFVFDHAGPLTSRGGQSRFRRPNSMMVAEIWKVQGGLIRQIEAVLDVFPYGMLTGWT
jgi:hypothetical protein